MNKLACGVVAVLTAAGVSRGAMIDVFVQVSGANMVPPVATEATGVLTGVLDTDLLQFSFEWNIADALNGMPTTIHFQRGAAGQNGPTIFNFGFAEFDPWPLQGNLVWDMTSADVDDLLAGLIYVNFRTSEHAAGEIRGQLPTPGSTALFALAGALLTRRKR